jgi:hypothetical protein
MIDVNAKETLIYFTNSLTHQNQRKGQISQAIRHFPSIDLGRETAPGVSPATMDWTEILRAETGQFPFFMAPSPDQK